VSSDFAELRRDFPAVCRHTYLNAAAASPTPRPVRAAVEAHHRQMEEDGDLHWDAWLKRKEEVRTTVARLVNADADEIAFVPNTSTGLNFIVDLLEHDGDVASDTLEFPTVTLPWIHRGVGMRFVEPRPGGVLEPEDFVTPPHVASATKNGQPTVGTAAFTSGAASEGTGTAAGTRATTGRDDSATSPLATILVSHVQFSNGCRQDLDAFGAIKGDRHLVVCGSQSTGAFPIDVRHSRIDAFATAGHKWLCAGYGAGFCYISRELLARRPRVMGWMSTRNPYAFDNRAYDLLPSNRRSELGCPPFASIFALGAAVDYLLGIGLERIEERVLALNTYLTDELARIGVPVLSPDGPHRSGESLCRFEDPAGVVSHLRSRDIHVTQKPEGIRVATHFYNDEQDIDRLIDELKVYGAAIPSIHRRSSGA
jgi:selenocysteine lyase/cysteine desulfurase